MGYTIIDGKREIEEAQKEFSEIFQSIKTIPVKKINNIPNHSVRWLEDMNFWIDTAILRNPEHNPREIYYWNACGIVKPTEFNIKLDITVQLGVDLEKAGNRAAAFIKDEFNNIYLTHTCNVNMGANKKHQSCKIKMKDYIFTNIDKKFIQIDNLPKRRLIVGCLNSNEFVKNLSEFVYEINRLKNNVTHISNGNTL